MIRSWRDASLTNAERQNFVESVLGPDNLQRMFWFIIAFLPVSVAGVVLNVILVHNESVALWSWFDLGLAVFFLILTVIARRQGDAIRWKHPLVFIYACYVLVAMDGYYFSLRPDYGENAYYILGALMVAILFRFPPRQFIPLLLLNHILVIAYLLSVVKDRDDMLLAIFSGINGLVIALLAAWFLFTKEWQNFENKRELMNANTLLTRRNAELNEVLAIAAHDLRSPLYSVKMIFDLSLDEKHPGEPAKTSLFQDGSRACSDMLSLIGRLLNSHVLEQRPSDLQMQTADLGQVIQEAVKRSHRAAEARGITLATDLVRNCETETDPDVFLQVLDNLLSNAIKFAPRETAVTVSLQDSTEGWLVEVKDAGPGISKTDQERIFEKYYRGSNQPAEEGVSLGLGLYIVKQLTEALGGRISYRPNVPAGGVFQVILPRTA